MPIVDMPSDMVLTKLGVSMGESLQSKPTAVGSVQNQQLSLAGMFWVTTALALLLSYASQQGRQWVNLALIDFGFVVLCGLVVGSIRRAWKDALFWGGLYCMLGFLAVAGGRLPHPSIAIGWGLVGALVGSCAGTQLPCSFVPAVTASAVLGWLSMVSVVLGMQQSLHGMILFDTFVAGVVGALLKPFTTMLQWFERESGQPRIVLASWLGTCVLIGNFLVPILGGVQR